VKSHSAFGAVFRIVRGHVGRLHNPNVKSSRSAARLEDQAVIALWVIVIISESALSDQVCHLMP
jgi:hypothetical protein